jgi:hypothetical protein
VGFTSALVARVEPIAAGFLDPLRLCLVRDALVRDGCPASSSGGCSSTPTPCREWSSFHLFELLGRCALIDEGVNLYAEACSCAPEEVRAEVLHFVREGLSRGALRPR